MKKKQLLEQVLLELQNIHYHFDRMEVFYKMVNGIKEDEKSGAWLQNKGKEEQ